ncbi:hypothetical protein VTN02DRAFT_778 [Thermoascus thermophilus]
MPHPTAQRSGRDAKNGPGPPSPAQHEGRRAAARGKVWANAKTSAAPLPALVDLTLPRLAGYVGPIGLSISPPGLRRSDAPRLACDPGSPNLAC